MNAIVAKQLLRSNEEDFETQLYGAPFVKTLYLTDLAQKLLSLRIFNYLCTRIFSYLCTYVAFSAQR